MVYKSSTPIDLDEAVNSASMSDHLVRVDNLKRLKQERGWSDADLGRQCGRQPQQLRAWWAYPAKGGRQIGEKLARSLEEELELPRYSLDERPVTATKLSTREGSMGYTLRVGAGSTTAPQNGTKVPVLTWEQIEKMLLDSNTRIGDNTPTLDTFVTHTDVAKFVAMPDDSMEPVYSAGDHILFDPAEAPHAGDTVLVRLQSGEHLVRLFRPKTATHWEAAPINSHYQAVRSSEEAAEIVAVMVEHRRYRRRRS